MPTGYTAPVKDGEITTFKDFALRCARAFGATIEFRDEPMGFDIEAKIKEIGQSSIDYHKKALAEARAERTDIEAMTEDEASVEAMREYDEALASYAKSVSEIITTRTRYSAMIDAVEEWEPPTPEHHGLKDFMMNQLRESIQFDCRYVPEQPRLKTPTEWTADRIESAERRVKYHGDELKKAQASAKTSRKWLTDLIASVSKEG